MSYSFSIPKKVCQLGTTHMAIVVARGLIWRVRAPLQGSVQRPPPVQVHLQEYCTAHVVAMGLTAGYMRRCRGTSSGHSQYRCIRRSTVLHM